MSSYAHLVCIDDARPGALPARFFPYSPSSYPLTSPVHKKSNEPLSYSPRPSPLRSVYALGHHCTYLIPETTPSVPSIPMAEQAPDERPPAKRSAPNDDFSSDDELDFQSLQKRFRPAPRQTFTPLVSRPTQRQPATMSTSVRVPVTSTTPSINRETPHRDSFSFAMPVARGWGDSATSSQGRVEKGKGKSYIASKWMRYIMERKGLPILDCGGCVKEDDDDEVDDNDDPEYRRTLHMSRQESLTNSSGK